MDLQTAIRTESRVEGDLLLVDTFLNHRVDPDVMAGVGVELAGILGESRPDLVLTAEASGIPPAMAVGGRLGLPVVYAKKYLGTGNRYSYYREVVSPTKGTEYRVEVARHVLAPGLRIAVVDDFLSGGRTAEALGEIAAEAGCEVVGFGFAIEKAFMGGRRRLERHGWRVDALVRVRSLEAGAVVFEEPVPVEGRR